MKTIVKVPAVYQQIKKHLLDDIVKGDIEFLSESWIIQKFKVSNTTAIRVLNELEDEGVVIRQVGRGTMVIDQQSKPKELGIIFFSILGTQDPYVIEILKGVEKKASANNCYMHLYTTRDTPICETPNLQLYHLISKKRLNGCFILSPVLPKDIRFFQEHKISFVVVGNQYPGIKTNAVNFDNYHTIQKAMEKLLSKGYKKIGVFTGLSGIKDNIIRSHDSIIKAYADFHNKSGLPYHPEMIFEMESTEENGYIAMQKISLLPENLRPQALIVTSSDTSKGVFRYLDKNKNCKTFIISYAFHSNEKKSMLPFISMNLQLLGETAFDLLNVNINNPEMEPEEIFLPLDIIWKKNEK